MKRQATKLTQRQLETLIYWQQNGFSVTRDEHVPETIIPPRSAEAPKPIELIVSAVGLIAIGIALYFLNGGF